MKNFSYEPQGVCTRHISFDIENGKTKANFYEGMGCVGGCVGGPKIIED